MGKMSAMEAANLILAENRRRVLEDGTGQEELLTNLKLQKLLYYAQGAFLALEDAPLFDDDIAAWRLGPVVETVYNQYRAFGRDPITEVTGPYAPEKLDARGWDTLEQVLDVFGTCSASGLVTMTHEEPPWQEAWKLGRGTPLDRKLMREYFLANHVEDE